MHPLSTAAVSTHDAVQDTHVLSSARALGVAAPAPEVPEAVDATVHVKPRSKKTSTNSAEAGIEKKKPARAKKRPKKSAAKAAEAEAEANTLSTKAAECPKKYAVQTADVLECTEPVAKGTLTAPTAPAPAPPPMPHLRQARVPNTVYSTPHGLRFWNGSALRCMCGRRPAACPKCKGTAATRKAPRRRKPKRAEPAAPSFWTVARDFMRLMTGYDALSS